MEKNIFENQLNEFISLSANLRPEFQGYYRFPCLDDDTSVTGFDAHYIYHVAWAVKKVFENKPAHHIDISSSLNFCTSICSVIPTTFIDYRPARLILDQLTCKSGDITDDSQWQENTYDSVSCMHVVEHIGLGRYGDKLDINGDLTAMSNLMKIVKPGGRLLFVAPTGIPEIYFNAHRVYSAQWIIDFFSSQFELNEFYYIFSDINKKPLLNCDLTLTEYVNYGCGCYEFIKK
jgi:SAM-dependent methyltransferase